MTLPITNISQRTKVWALWNIKKSAYYSTGHGCVGGVNIVNFETPERASAFRDRINGVELYNIKAIYVGG